MKHPVVAAVLLSLACSSPLPAARLKSWALVHERMLALQIVDSTAQISMPGKLVEEKVLQQPLSLGLARLASNYKLRSARDPFYGEAGREPLRVGRKSKGRDYMMLQKPQFHIEHGMEHWLYLELPSPLRAGKDYRLDLTELYLEQRDVKFTYQPTQTRSDSVHVNQVGFRSGSAKRAYVSAWAGELGPVNFKFAEGKPFHVIEAYGGKSAFDGVLRLRKGMAEPDSGQAKEGNHLRSDLYEADFSALKQPGSYVVSVEGVGCSYLFSIGENVYRAPFRTAMRGLYHQRCGTALVKPYGAYERAACHHPSTRKIVQSRIRRLDRQCDACKDVEATEETRDVAGGWHDAGDWDREDWHFGVPLVLSFIYEMAPQNFKDGELLIPEAGNGLPDILDEAQWGLDYWRRLQRADGGISPGLFLDSFPDPGEAPETCTGNWYIYAEDPQASYRYAAVACHFAFALEKAGRAKDMPIWVKSAAKAYQWAEKNQRSGDAIKVKDDRLHAAAALFRATSEPGYHAAFKKGLAIDTATTALTVWDKWDQAWAVFTYLSTPRGTDAALVARLKQATQHYARTDFLDPAAKRGMRSAVGWYRPLIWGGVTQPEDLPLIASHALCADAEALAGAEANLDVFLGAGPLNLSFMMGVGKSNPDGIFHPDSWMHLGSGKVAPGIMGLGPSAYEAEGDPKSGPWDFKYTHLAFYPPAKTWPPFELYADARVCFPMNEFTVMQIAQVAAQFGYLAGKVYTGN